MEEKKRISTGYENKTVNQLIFESQMITMELARRIKQ